MGGQTGGTQAWTGNDLVAQALLGCGVDRYFFLMGGPVLGLLSSCESAGLTGIDVRHEQAAVMMAHAWARTTGSPGLAIVSSGPGVTNAITGMATAFDDRAPVVLLGGAAPVAQFDREGFQSGDQLEYFRSISKWSARVHDPDRLGEYIVRAFETASHGAPGPVYLDLPGDVLYAKTSITTARVPRARTATDPEPASLDALHAAIASSERPVIVAGSGCVWSGAGESLLAVSKQLDIPVFTTPAARGLVPESDSNVPTAARSFAFANADLAILVGTRPNFVLNFMRPPRWSSSVKVARIDISAEALIGASDVHVPVMGDAKRTLDGLSRLAEGYAPGPRASEWFTKLRDLHRQRTETPARPKADRAPGTHLDPVDVCATLDAFLRERADAVLVTDGHETLNFARRWIRAPATQLSPGPFGTMGVGIPFALGAKVASPQSYVLCFTGDGAAGLSWMEFDTAVRHSIDITVVVMNNGGWTALSNAPGRDLGFTPFEGMAVTLGGHGELVESIEELQEALQRTVGRSGPTCLNVRVDPKARSQTQKFTDYGGDSDSYL